MQTFIYNSYIYRRQNLEVERRMKISKINPIGDTPIMQLRLKNKGETVEKIDVKKIDDEINIILQMIFKTYPYIAAPYIYLGRAYVNWGTAAITANGWLLINPHWWVRRTQEEKHFVIIHEILHAMLKHPIRGPTVMPKEYNIIADAIVNTFALSTLADIINRNKSAGSTITPEQIKEKLERVSMRNLIDWDHIRKLFKENGLEPPENLEKLSADEIFTRLYHGKIKNDKIRQTLEKSSGGSGGSSGACNRQQHQSTSSCGGQGSSGGQQQGQGSGGGNSGQNSSSGGGGGGGRRQKKYRGRNMIQNDRGQGSGKGQQQKQGSAGGGGINTTNEDIQNGPLGGDLMHHFDPNEHPDAEVTKKPHPMFDNVRDKSSAENAWKRIHYEAANFQRLANIRNKQAGVGAGAIEELIELIEGENKIPWQKIVKEAVREHYRGFTDRSYKKEDRRYAAMQRINDRRNNLYLPGVVRYNIPDIHVTFDTSGSMSEEELKQILIEVYTIAKKFRTKIRVTQWDWDIQDDRIVRNPDEFKVFTVRGRGGTSIIPVLQYVAGERDFNGKKYELQRESLFIVFSDMELFDDPDEVIKYLVKIHKKKRVRFLFVNTQTFNVFDSKRLGVVRAFRMALADR